MMTTLLHNLLVAMAPLLQDASETAISLGDNPTLISILVAILAGSATSIIGTIRTTLNIRNEMMQDRAERKQQEEDREAQRKKDYDEREARREGVIDELREKARKLNDEHMRMVEERQSMKNAIRRLEDDSKLDAAKIARLETDLGKSEKRNFELQLQVERLTENIKNIKEQHAELKRSASEKDRNNELLIKQTERYRDRERRLNADLVAAQAEIKELRQRYENTFDKILDEHVSNIPTPNLPRKLDTGKITGEHPESKPDDPQEPEEPNGNHKTEKETDNGNVA